MIERYRNGRDPFRICSPDGSVDRDRLNFELSESFLTDVYRLLVYNRKIDTRAVNLQRQGRLGTYAPCQGQEGCQVGLVKALDERDPLFPTYRETAALITRGIPLEKIYQYWSGDERGSTWDRGFRVFPISIPVGSQGLHGVGASYALQYQGESQLSVVFLGDGATSEGDMLEAMNFAGSWETPVLFFCQNNQWAISVPREKQTESKTLSQKADAFGFQGIRVDGNDPLATYQLVDDLRSFCLENSEPLFVEAVTYRLGDHTTSDDAKRYRSEEEVEEWERKDPIRRIRSLLESEYGWNEDRENELRESLDDEIDAAVEAMEELSPPDSGSMFEYLYEEIPSHLEDQRRDLREEQGSD